MAEELQPDLVKYTYNVKIWSLMIIWH